MVDLYARLCGDLTISRGNRISKRESYMARLSHEYVPNEFCELDVADRMNE